VGREVADAVLERGATVGRVYAVPAAAALVRSRGGGVGAVLSGQPAGADDLVRGESACPGDLGHFHARSGDWLSDLVLRGLQVEWAARGGLLRELQRDLSGDQREELCVLPRIRQRGSLPGWERPSGLRCERALRIRGDVGFRRGP